MNRSGYRNPACLRLPSCPSIDPAPANASAFAALRSGRRSARFIKPASCSRRNTRTANSSCLPADCTSLRSRALCPVFFACTPWLGSAAAKSPSCCGGMGFHLARIRNPEQLEARPKRQRFFGAGTKSFPQCGQRTLSKSTRLSSSAEISRPHSVQVVVREARIASRSSLERRGSWKSPYGMPRDTDSMRDT